MDQNRLLYASTSYLYSSLVCCDILLFLFKFCDLKYFIQGYKVKLFQTDTSTILCFFSPFDWGWIWKVVEFTISTEATVPHSDQFPPEPMELYTSMTDALQWHRPIISHTPYSPIRMRAELCQNEQERGGHHLWERNRCSQWAREQSSSQVP